MKNLEIKPPFERRGSFLGRRACKPQSFVSLRDMVCLLISTLASARLVWICLEVKKTQPQWGKKKYEVVLKFSDFIMISS